MEQNTVENIPVMEQPAQADVAQDNVVYAADLMKPETPKADAQEKPAAQVQQEKPKTAPAKTQEEIDRALSVRLKDAERKAQMKAESSPEFLAGKYAIDALAAKENISREAAAKRIQQEYEQQENQRLAENPAEMVRTLKNLIAKEPQVDQEPEPQTIQDTPSIDQFIAEAKTVIGEAYKNGLIPDGYTVTTSDIDAIYNNRSNPIKLAAFFAGLKTAAPVEQVTDDGEATQQGRNHAPIRTTSENARSMEKDYRDLPDKDFEAMLEEVKNQTREGKRVKF